MMTLFESTLIATIIILIAVALWLWQRFRSAQKDKEGLEHQLATHEKMSEHFKALASDALNQNNEAFIQLAQERFKRSEETQEHKLNELVKPLHEALGQTQAQIQALEKQRAEAYGSLSGQIETMIKAEQALRDTSYHLAEALRNRPEVRGRWGEMTLKRLVELAGMSEYCDFDEQVSYYSEQGRQRPDMIIRLPEKRTIIIDSKTPLNAYLDAQESESEEQRKQHLDLHVRNIQMRIRELSSKEYWKNFSDSLDFVILFLPGEQFLSSALAHDRNHNLMDYALNARIILSTPNSLFALLRAIAFGWQQKKVAENSEEIQRLGKQLHERLSVFTTHLVKIGKNLDKSVESYNQTIGSLDANLTPTIKRFEQLGIRSEKTLDSTSLIDASTRHSKAEYKN